MFLSQDPWEGDALRPGSMNGWNYVEGNPVNQTDASGQGVCLYPYHWETDPATGERHCVPLFPEEPGQPPLPFGFDTAAGTNSTPTIVPGAIVIVGIGVCLYLINQLTQPVTRPDISRLPEDKAQPSRTLVPPPVLGNNPKKCDPIKVTAWKATLPTRPARTDTDAFRYQTRHTGPTEYLVTGGGHSAWADGIRDEDCYLLDAKHVGDPDNSPYVPGSQAPSFIRQQVYQQEDDLFRRYAAALRDPTTPLTGLEIITNEPRSVVYWQGFLNQQSVPGGRIVVRP